MCHKEKIRDEKELKSLIIRLNRIEGQIRGIKKMVGDNAYCPDILIQTSAIKSAINAFNKELLSNHIRTCVSDDLKNGNSSTIDELIDTFNKLLKY